MAIPATLARLVRRRAGGRCEYCHLPEHLSNLSFHVDHIVALKHRGSTTAANLALSCSFCNSFKGTDATGLNTDTGRFIRLFNPRRQRWATHFRWRGAVLVGRTPVGRTTILALNINDLSRVNHRRALKDEGLFPFD